MKVKTQLLGCGTNNSATIKIAYLILVHRLPIQFKQLFKAIYHPDNYYVIHIDKKTSPSLNEDLALFLSDYPNAYIIESTNVIWGGYSMVQAELDGMNFLLSMHTDWEYFINLSGQDFPLKSQTYIQEYLAKDTTLNFIKTDNQKLLRPDTMNRVSNYYTEIDTEVSRFIHRRKYMENVTPYIGGQWMILNRTCCDFICNSAEVKKFEDYYQNTFIADESFFQTVLMNTSFDGTIVNDDKRAIIWVPDGDIKLRPKTFTISDLPFLLDSNGLFARKFDNQVDESITNALELNIGNNNIPNIAVLNNTVQEMLN